MAIKYLPTVNHGLNEYIKFIEEIVRKLNRLIDEDVHLQTQR
jgi:hypothetical protein